MNNVKPLFEQFESSEQGQLAEPSPAEGVQLQQAKAAAYTEGYAAGETAAKAKHDAENIFLESLTHEFGFLADVFQRQVAKDLCDALEDCIRTILPTAAKNEFAKEVREIVEKSLDRSEQQAITLKVSPDNKSVLENALKDHVEAKKIVIEPTPAIKGLEVLAHWNASGFSLNLQEAIDSTISYLEGASSKLRDETAV